MTATDKSDIYIMTKPDDVDEKNRLDLQHQVWLLTLGNNLHKTPLPRNLRTILDIGTGTGIWATSMARAWPTAQVLATDLVLPKAPPSVSNLTYLKHDADSVWDFEPQSFDFMHGRMLTSGIHDWPALLSKAWAHLAPGGRLELLDVCHPFRAGATQADNPEASPFIRFGHLAQKSWEKSGLDYYATTKHVERMQQLGFVDIAEHVFKWPLGKWAETDQEKKMGELTLGNFSRFLATAGTAILTHQGFMDEDDAKRVVAEAEQDLQQNHEAKQFYLTIFVHTASKPKA